MKYADQWHEVERRSRCHTDYDALRKTGAISVCVEDAAAWREAIRSRAQADGISVRTGVSRERGDVAWALLRWPAPGRAELRNRMQEDADLREVIRAAEAQSRMLAHSLEEWHREPVARRAISACRRCGARVYVEIQHSMHVFDGAAVERPCASEKSS